MKNMKINFVDNVELKYKVPEVPKGAKSYVKHFYDKFMRNIPKKKLIKFPSINKN